MWKWFQWELLSSWCEAGHHTCTCMKARVFTSTLSLLIHSNSQRAHLCFWFTDNLQCFFKEAELTTHTHIHPPPLGPFLARFPIIPLVHTTKRHPSAACSPSERRAPSRRRHHYGEWWFSRGTLSLRSEPENTELLVLLLLRLLCCVQIDDALHTQRVGCLVWQRRRLLIMFSMPSIQSHVNWSWSRGLWEWSEW